MRLPLKWISLGLLALILIEAMEIPAWFVLVAKLPIPWFGHYLPYMAPILFAVLGFNMAVNYRLRDGQLQFVPETLLFILFVVAIAIIEFVHWLRVGGDMQLWLVLAWVWMLVFFLTLRSFEYYLPDCRHQLLRLTVGLASCVAALDFLLAIVLAPAWGKAPLGLSSDQLFDSAYVAYLAVFAVAVLLFEWPPRELRGKMVAYLMLVPGLTCVAYLQRLAGPMLILMALFAIKAFLVLPRRASLWVLLPSLLAVIGMWLNAAVLSKDPTLAGLGGGQFFFDEIGLVHGDLISSFTRRETILAELREFLDSPILGVGMAQASTVKVLGSGMHSSLVYIPVTTGLVGVGMMCLWLGWCAWGKVRREGVGGLPLFVLLGGMMLFSPEPVWWWSILFFLVSPAVGSGNSRGAC